MTARYVGVGVSTYDDGDHYPDLPRAASDVKEVADALKERDVDVDVMIDPTRQDYSTNFGDGVGDSSGLILYWAGHARPIPGGLGLILRDSPGVGVSMMTVADPRHLLSWALTSGAERVLFILDTCWAGGALGELADLASRFDASVTRPAGARTWVGIVAAAQSYENAVGGRLCDELVKLLRHGPESIEMRRIWSAHNEGLHGTDLIRVISKEWPERFRQQVRAVQYGDSPDALLPNLKHVPSAPERLMAELLDPAGRGAGPGEAGWFFTGRRRLLEQLTQWMEASGPGLFVITGPPGSGKSAVLGRLHSLADPERRARIPEASLPGPGELDVDALRIDLALHARNQDLKALRTAVAHQLGITGNAGKYAILERLEGMDRPPVILIDGLDEVHTGSLNRVVNDLLIPLAECAQVLVGTRNRILEDGTTLIDLFRPEDTVRDLVDEPQSAADLRAYIAARMEGTANDVVADIVAEVSERAEQEGGFLYARMVTTQLRAEPVRTTEQGWRDRISGSIAEVLRRELAKASGSPGQAAALLTALAWSFGNGLPAHTVWPALAAAITGGVTDPADATVDQALFDFRSYIIEAGEDGHAVYRLFHQELVTQLRGDPPAGALVDRAVLRLLAEHSENGRYPGRVDPYVERHAHRHAARGGAETIAVLRVLADNNPGEYRPKLAEALYLWALRLSDQQDRDAALAVAVDAIDLRRDLAVAYPGTYTADLIGSLEQASDLYAARQDTGAAERRFMETVAALSDLSDRARLYLWRSQGLAGRTWPQRVEDAATAMDLLPDDGTQTTLIVQSAIRDRLVDLYRRQPSDFTAWWARRYGDIPTWLADMRLRLVLVEWRLQPGWVHSESFALEHPELADPQAAVLLDQFPPAFPADPSLDPHRKLIRWIADHGVRWAYRRIAAEETLRIWLSMAPDWDQSQEYLRKHSPTVAHPDSADILTSFAGERVPPPYLEIHRALLLLCRRHETIRGYRILRGDRESAFVGAEHLAPEVQAALRYLADHPDSDG